MAIDRHDTDTDTTKRVAPPTGTNVNVGPASAAPVATNNSVLVVTRVVVVLFTVIEVLLLIRFFLKVLGANAGQPLVDGLYRITEPLVRPFQGIFPNPDGTAVDLPALLAVVFFFLLAALVVAIVRAVLGNRATSY